MAPISPISCWRRAISSTASSAGPRLLNTARIDHLYHDRHDADVRLFLHYGDMTDSTNLCGWWAR